MERGALHPLHRGVYAVGHPVITRRGRWMAAVLASGPEAVLSHRSAGVLWQLLRPSSKEIEVTRPRTCRGRPGVKVHRARVRPDEASTVDGIPVTGLSRTLLDLAGAVSRRMLERAWNEAEVLGLTDRVSVPDLLERYPRCRGSVALRSLLVGEESFRGLTQNEFEEAFAALIDTHGLPPRDSTRTWQFVAAFSGPTRCVGPSG